MARANRRWRPVRGRGFAHPSALGSRGSSASRRHDLPDRQTLDSTRRHAGVFGCVRGVPRSPRGVVLTRRWSDRDQRSECSWTATLVRGRRGADGRDRRGAGRVQGRLGAARHVGSLRDPRVLGRPSRRGGPRGHERAWTGPERVRRHGDGRSRGRLANFTVRGFGLDGLWTTSSRPYPRRRRRMSRQRSSPRTNRPVVGENRSTRPAR